MSTDSRRTIHATKQPRGRAAALATKRQSVPLVKPAPKPQPTKPRFSQPPEVTQEVILVSAPQAAASQAMHPADSTTESTRSSTAESFAAAREQVEKADQMTARMSASSAAERQTLTTPNFAAYVHASTATVRDMQQLGQLWVSLVQASLRHSAALAFDWTMRR